jgi:hypothetical protein
LLAHISGTWLLKSEAPIFSSSSDMTTSPLIAFLIDFKLAWIT